MKILITGNMGYVGPGLLAMLRRTYPDAELCGYDMGYFAHALTNTSFLPERNLDTQYFGDIRHMQPELLQSVDVLIHLAKGSSSDKVDHTERITLQLATKAKLAGVKAFIDPYRPGKNPAAAALQGLSGENFRVTALQFGTACGMTDRLRLDLILNDFVFTAINDGSITVPGDANDCISLIHVKDMARAITWAVGMENRPTFLNLAAGSPEWTYRRSELAAIVAELVPGTIVHCNDSKVMPCSSEMDFETFRQLAPKHQPRYTIKQTILELYAGLLEMGIGYNAFDPELLKRSNMPEALQVI